LLPLVFGTKACSAGDVPKVPKAWELSASALFYFWGFASGMPYTNDLYQIEIVFESLNYPIWRNNHLMEILLIELWHYSPHTRMLLKHLDSRNDPVTEMFSLPRTVH